MLIHAATFSGLSDHGQMLGLVLAVRAVILSASAKWFNYRHSSNAFAVGRMLRDNAIPRSDIFIACGADPAFSPRNPHPGRVLAYGRTDDVHEMPNLTGDDVTVDHFRALLSRGPVRGRMTNLSGAAHMLLYLTGHGGDEFLKFRDAEELRAAEFVATVSAMKRVLRFRELLIILDTCQAESFFRHIATDGVTAIASSAAGQTAKSSSYDSVIGVPTGDLFSAAFCSCVMRLGRNATIADLWTDLAKVNVESTPKVVQFNAPRPLGEMHLADFFFG
jgi:phosphatidylinositol glycan class K